MNNTRKRKISGLDVTVVKNCMFYLTEHSQNALASEEYNDPKLEKEVELFRPLLMEIEFGKFVPCFLHWNDLAFASKCAIVYKKLVYEKIPFNGSAEEFFEILHNGLNKYAEKSANMFLYYFGFVDGKAHTLEEAGKLVSIGKSGAEGRISTTIHSLRDHCNFSITREDEKAVFNSKAYKTGYEAADTFLKSLTRIPVEALDFSEESFKFFKMVNITNLSQAFANDIFTRYEVCVTFEIRNDINSVKRTYILKIFGM